MIRLVVIATLALGLFAAPQSGFAQDGAKPVLTIDWLAFLRETQYGRRLAAEFQAEKDALQAEWDRIELELLQEEEELVRQRQIVSAEEFRTLSKAFDQKVVAVRREQRERRAELPEKEMAYSRALLQAAGPILFELVQQNGASVLIDKRNVLVNLSSVDVTRQAIQEMDRRIGDGTTQSPTAE
jgi:Skp family chaperone for outer membrane proteins